MKERGGSSRAAILRYIMKNFNVGKDEKMVNTHLKMALRSGVKKGGLKQAKGTGATGSFRIGATPKKAAKKRKPKAKKAKKARKPKKAKKAKSPRKAKKSTKKAARPKKAKKAAKPKAAKSKKAAKPRAKKPRAKKAGKGKSKK